MRTLGKIPPNRKGSVIKCECGVEIPVIPDAKAVGTTIDTHIEEHRKKHKDPVEAEKAADHIHDYLFTALFKKIADEE
jgi:predicted metal-dependent phosphoesterase TrpH